MITRKIKSIVLIIVLLFIDCQRDKSPLSIQKIDNYLYTPGEGFLKKSNGQLYYLYREDNHPYYGNLHQAPDSIVAISKKYLIEYFGQDYFNQYFTFRSSIIISENWYTVDIGGKYLVTYYYQIYINDYTTNLVVATYHDSLGNVLADEGVVDRLSDSNLGIPFKIDNKKAVEIAKRNQFSSGYFPWHVVFKFKSKMKLYVWNIKNQTEVLSGQGIEIDAITGDIRGEYIWCIADADGW